MWRSLQVALTHCVVIVVGLMMQHSGFAEEPPRLSDVVVDPSNLVLGTGEQTVTISVMVSDADGDVDPQNVKLKKVRIGKKNPTVALLTDDGQNGDARAGDRRFTARLSFDTGLPRQRTFRIKAKDRSGNKAAPVSVTVVVGPQLGLSSMPPAATLNLTLQRVFPELTFSDPVALLQAPHDDTRWFLVERTGIIRSFLNRQDASDSQTVLDFRHVVEPISELDLELGMLALAFHPRFSENGTAYIYYTAERDNVIESRLSRFTSLDLGMTLDADSEEVLLRVEQPRNRHNGGQLLFGPDGFLYLSLGDGGDRFQSQDRESVLGKMLRIDVDGGMPYAIPSDNPFVGEEGRPEIYAMGLRNPWRWSFDPKTGVIWLGDVGNNRWEEIDIIVPGANYGWPIFEGSECAGFLPCEMSSLVSPILVYSHDDGCAVIGGHVYRGVAFPELDGVYLFSDVCSAAVVGLSTDAAGALVQTVLVQGDHDVATGNFGLLMRSLALDQAGELYLVESGGRIFTLAASGF